MPSVLMGSFLTPSESLEEELALVFSEVHAATPAVSPASIAPCMNLRRAKSPACWTMKYLLGEWRETRRTGRTKAGVAYWSCVGGSRE
jgi:hypothetical protein